MNTQYTLLAGRAITLQHPSFCFYGADGRFFAAAGLLAWHDDLSRASAGRTTTGIAVLILSNLLSRLSSNKVSAFVVLSAVVSNLLCSKAAHRVSTLLQAHFGLSDLTPDSPRLFASLLPPEEKKAEALRYVG